MSVHELTAEVGALYPQHYYACPDCGWCSPLRSNSEAAELDGVKHQEIKAATRDEQR